MVGVDPLYCRRGNKDFLRLAVLVPLKKGGGDVTNNNQNNIDFLNGHEFPDLIRLFYPVLSRCCFVFFSSHGTLLHVSTVTAREARPSG